MEVLNMGDSSESKIPGHTTGQQEGSRSPRRSPRLPILPAQARRAAEAGAVPNYNFQQSESVEFPKLIERDHNRKRVIPKFRSHRFYSEGSQSLDEDKYFNSDGVHVPFLGQEFRSSLRRVKVVGLSLPNIPLRKEPSLPSRKPSILDRPSAKVKRIPTSRRHGDMWPAGSDITGLDRSKGVSDFYPSTMSVGSQMWDDAFSSAAESDLELLGLSQQDRLILEWEYLDKMRGLKRKGELLPHREPLNLTMGGTKVEMSERLDIMSEISRLKKVVLPTRARDLYVGRGFQLPESHALNKAKLLYPHTIRNCLISPTGRPPTHLPKLPSTSSNTNSVHVLSITGNETSGFNIEFPSYNFQDREALWSEADNDLVKQSKPDSEKIVASVSKVEHRPEDLKEEPVPVDIPLKETTMASNGQENTVPRPPPPSETEATPSVPATPNQPVLGTLLNVGNIYEVVEADRVHTLRNDFQTLDKPGNGEVEFEQIKTKLPQDLGDEQDKFTKQVYHLARANGFGEDQFVSLFCMCQKIASLEGAAEDAFQRLDFNNLQQALSKYLDLFKSVDHQNTGQISLDALREILSTAISKDLETDGQYLQDIMAVILKGHQQDQMVSKIDYLACVPYFISLEPN